MSSGGCAQPNLTWNRGPLCCGDRVPAVRDCACHLHTSAGYDGAVSPQMDVSARIGNWNSQNITNLLMNMIVRYTGNIHFRHWFWSLLDSLFIKFINLAKNLSTTLQAWDFTKYVLSKSLASHLLMLVAGISQSSLNRPSILNCWPLSSSLDLEAVHCGYCNAFYFVIVFSCAALITCASSSTHPPQGVAAWDSHVVTEKAIQASCKGNEVTRSMIGKPVWRSELGLNGKEKLRSCT